MTGSRWTRRCWWENRSSGAHGSQWSSWIQHLANGWSDEQILKNYPHLTGDDIRAALHYAAEAVKQEHVYHLPV